ncbi:hypothetical protein [Chitinophaga barathri]|uniref:Uncharacterized protein n=1 Tax=Chitinophaga barathri TaxID=1647451 RepID=A0A3N4MFQ1_9BACT|nr:hypothetical protein [Chitinophaga barathri]RPD40507.1 hypothetical protein EG028_14470 [Chitinophaga barathri]
MTRPTILFLTLAMLAGCFPQQDIVTGEKKPYEFSIPTVNKKKARRKILPTIAFSNAMKRYRKERGFFPQDMRAFEYYSDYTRTAMQSMRENGFKELYISYLYLDSMVIDFWHQPIYSQKLGSSKYGIDLSGQLIYVKSDTNFYEYRRFDKSLPKRVSYQYVPDTTTNYRR